MAHCDLRAAPTNVRSWESNGLKRTRRLSAVHDRPCVKTHTSAKCRKHNSPARHRTSRVQYDLTLRDAIARRYFHVWRDRWSFRTWGNSGIVPYEGTGNQLSRNRQRPTSWSLAIMESRNGALCRTRRFAEADSDLHRRSDRKDRARRGRCIQPGGNRRIHQVARAACRTDRARDGSNVDMAMDRTA